MATSHSKHAPADGKPSFPGTGAAYIRVSTDKQDTERQYDSINAFQSRYGVTIPPRNWFKDEGYARDEADSRPDFQRMVRMAESGTIQWVVVDRLDRFGTKNEKQLISYLYRLEEAKCRLFDASGKCWSDQDIATIITAVVEASKSKGEQIEKSHRTLGGKKALAKDGEWMGGGARFGFDVGCFSRETDKELWRVVFQGKDKRLKVWPDGREERFDGKRNFPPTAVTELKRITPTKDKAKLQAVRTLFKRFADESVTVSALAKWLNDLGYRNGNGGMFQGVHVEQLLEDTAYIGHYAYSKWAKGKFNHLENGQIVHELNYTQAARKHTPDQWQKSDKLFAPLIDQETWDKVQAKLTAAPTRAKAPQTTKMIYSGLLYCGGCGLLMRSKGANLEYFCGSWHRVSAGLLDRCDCRRNPVKQEVVEHYVEKFLDNTATKLDTLVNGLTVDDLTAPREREYRGEWTAFTDSLDAIAAYLSKHHPDAYSQLLSAEGNVAASLIAAYRSLFSPIEINRELAQLQSEHDQIVAKFLDLPKSAGKALTAVTDRMVAVEERMKLLESQRDNAADRAEQHLKQLRDLRHAIKEAKAAVKQGGERTIRARAEALRRVISRIECQFEEAPRKSLGYRQGATPASRLVGVTIYPVDGEPLEFKGIAQGYDLPPVTTVK